MSSPPPHDCAPPAAAARERGLARFSLDFVVETVSGGIDGLKTLDCVLMMAINQANIAPLTRNPEARRRYGALDAPAPDHERRPVSVRAVATSLGLAYETARRNIRRLEARGVCVTGEAGVIVPAAFLLSPAYLDAARRGHEGLYDLYRTLQARGLLKPLPGRNYDEVEPPVRGAVRLMADYLLRTAEAVVRRTGDLISGMVLLPVLVAAEASDGPVARPRSASALARRIGLPAETVRRHAQGLVAAGLCAVAPGGLVLADPEAESWASLRRENAIAVQRLYAGLAERGVVEAWERMAAAVALQGGSL